MVQPTFNRTAEKREVLFQPEFPRGQPRLTDQENHPQLNGKQTEVPNTTEPYASRISTNSSRRTQPVISAAPTASGRRTG